MKRFIFILAAGFLLAVSASAQTAPAFPYIYPGYAAGLQFVVQVNGAAYAPPAGTAYVPAVTWTVDDKLATLTPGPDTTKVLVAIPATDTATTVTVTGTALAPDGKTVLTTSFQLPTLPVPVTYRAVIIQVSATNP